MEESKEHHHVHFDEKKDLIGKDNEIIVQEKNSTFDVHLGFLQYKHKYKITFSICKPAWDLKDGSTVSIVNLTNPHLHILSAKVTKQSIVYELELLPHKEKLLTEEFGFHLSEKENQFSVVLHARVLGKGKGTPLLKNGVHLIHEPIDDDSDDSS